MADSDELSVESVRASVGEASMKVMDAVDEDFNTMLKTFSEHILLMTRELTRRDIDHDHAIAIITSFTVTAAIECLRDD